MAHGRTNSLLANASAISYQRFMASTRSSASSREFDLMLRCCAVGFDGERAAGLADEIAECDAATLAALAHRHRVEALVWEASTGAGAALPESVAADLRSQSQARQRQNLQSMAAIASLDCEFATAGVDFLLIKGLATAALAYRNPMARTGRDIDILVEPHEVERAAVSLKRLGFEPRLPQRRHADWHRTHKESVWECSDGLILELHSNLVDNERLIPLIGMASPRQSVSVGDRCVETLGPSDLIAYTAVHGSWSLWFRAKWIVDLAALLWVRHGKETVDESLEAAWDAGAGRAASLGFLLVHKLFGTRLGTRLLDSLTGDRVLVRLQRAAMAIMQADEPTHRRFGTTVLRANQLLLMPTPGAAVQEAARQVREVVTNRFA